MHIQSILLPKLRTCISLLNLYTYILEVFCYPKIIYTHAFAKLVHTHIPKIFATQKKHFMRIQVSCYSNYISIQQGVFGEVSCHLNIYLGEALFAIYMQHTYML